MRVVKRSNLTAKWSTNFQKHAKRLFKKWINLLTAFLSLRQQAVASVPSEQATAKDPSTRSVYDAYQTPALPGPAAKQTSAASS